MSVKRFDIESFLSEVKYILHFSNSSIMMQYDTYMQQQRILHALNDSIERKKELLSEVCSN
jgi:hypothetical protein